MPVPLAAKGQSCRPSIEIYNHRRTCSCDFQPSGKGMRGLEGNRVCTWLCSVPFKSHSKRFSQTSGILLLLFFSLPLTFTPTDKMPNHPFATVAVVGVSIAVAVC